MFLGIYVCFCILSLFCKIVTWMSYQDLQRNSYPTLCEIGDHQIFYKTSCLDGTCLFCGSLQLISTCQHMDSTHAIRNKIVDYEKYKTVAYALKDGK